MNIVSCSRNLSRAGKKFGKTPKFFSRKGRKGRIERKSRREAFR